MAPPDQDRSQGARELVLASAGSGKTYQLSSRLIGLLREGVPPQEILASTFTRKAAGEIVDRVLVRIARGVLDPKEAVELARSLGLEAEGEEAGPRAWGELLARTVREMHRLQVHTLDAFFHRVAHSFAQELGLPQRWEVAAEPDRERLRTRAIEAALLELDPEVLIELVRLVSRGGADRDVHRLLSDGVAALYRLYKELDPTVDDPWGFAGGAGSFGTASDNELDDLGDALEGAVLPGTKAGAEDKRWVTAREKGVALLRARDLGGFLTGGLGGAILGGTGEFNGKAIPGDILALGKPLLRIARARLGVHFHRRVAALGRFLPEYDRRLRRILKEEAIYDFEDLTYSLMEGGGLGRREELFYRLDARIRHVLLDEFQDTSNAQWAALEPLVGEILAAPEEGRAVFLVGDPKQSIYSWRGGEPRLLDLVAERYGLELSSVALNWRSSQVVLDTVNRVFDGVSESPILHEDPEVAERWARAFHAHSAKKDLPGYVRIEAGADDRTSGSRAARVALLDRGAALTQKIHEDAPGATIGVLMRTNRAAAYTIARLRRMGVEASEEGGVPVADSEPVLALLALLRMADHPGDKISRYVVARTPVGALVGMAPDAWPSGREAERIAHAVRTRLLEEGYGTVVSAWTRALSDAAPARDRSRLRQLAELAFEWDRRATLRPSDFVRHVEAARAEDPATAAIRVMTIHKAKGLEFDAVVLPELDGVALAGDVREPFLPFRAGGAGPVQRVFPTVPKALRPLFPEMAGAIAQAREREVRDGLSTLYVALTRARHALYIVVKPASARTTARTAARLLAATLWPGRGTGPAEILWEDGVADWWSDTRLEGQLLRPFVSAHARAREARPAAIGLAAGARRRLLPRRAPSELEGGEIVRLEDLLRPASRLSREEGTAVHAWLEAIGWREDGLPERTALLALAAERSPRLGDASALLDHFLKWIARPEVAALLRRASYPSGTTVEREVSFIARDGPRLLQGVVDRLVRIPEAGGPRLVAVDWKTDALDPADASALEARAAYYRPQIEAYLRALAAGERLPKEKVRGLLVFLRPGVVREISLS